MHMNMFCCESGVDKLQTYETLLRQVRYSNSRPEHVNSRSFLISCSVELNQRFVSDQFQVQVQRQIHPFTHTSICPLIHLYIYRSIYSINASTHLSIHLSIHPPIHPPTHPSTYHPSIYLLTDPSIPFIHPPISPSTYPSTHSSTQPSFHLSIYSSIYSIHTSTHPTSLHPPIHPSVHSSTHAFTLQSSRVILRYLGNFKFS